MYSQVLEPAPNALHSKPSTQHTGPHGRHQLVRKQKAWGTTLIGVAERNTRQGRENRLGLASLNSVVGSKLVFSSQVLGPGMSEREDCCFLGITGQIVIAEVGLQIG